jgi:glycosyltransferase involved in cell wall biosynthesis
MFETDRIPEGWSERLNEMDYVWVPTQFHREIFSQNGVESSKLRIIPEGVDTEFYHGNNDAISPARRYDFPPCGAEKPYKFLSVFKWEERKGWQFLLRAYLTEFSAAENVCLYILTSAYHSDADFQQKITEFSATLALPTENHTFPSVKLLATGIPDELMPSFYAGADSFVLPSRGEGWGRPHIEAASSGLPVIATNWSGPTEFLNENNSFPLRIEPELEEITEGAFSGHFWAKPSVEHLKERMREVYSEPERAREKGRQAQRDMRHKYCLKCVADLLLEEFDEISTRYNSRNKELQDNSHLNSHTEL